MISKAELLRIAGEKQIDPTVIERDYALGWVLWGLSQEPLFTDNMIFKGGTSLKKCWFEDYRFSEDLDFTATKALDETEIKDSLESIIHNVSEESGLTFYEDRTNIRIRTPAKARGERNDLKAYNASIYFSGPRSDTRNPLRVKFDITNFEKMVLSPEIMEIMHPYSDATDCRCKVNTYCIEEIIGEKLRALLQRSRPRDYYDIYYILKDKIGSVNIGKIIDAFKKKAEYKEVPFDDVESLIGDDKYNAIEPTWGSQLDHQLTYAPKPELVRPEFNKLVTSLFTKEIPKLVEKISTPEKYLSNPKILSNKEKIIQAGKATRVIKMLYNGDSRVVEPYSFRYQGGTEYFYGFNLSGGSSPPGIRSFLTKKIQSIEITSKTYSPRWPVEF